MSIPIDYTDLTIVLGSCGFFLGCEIGVGFFP